MRQDIGKTICRRAKRCIGEIADAVVAPDPAQRKLFAASGFYMPIDRLVSDVEAVAGKPFKQASSFRNRRLLLPTQNLNDLCSSRERASTESQVRALDTVCLEPVMNFWRW